MELNTLTAITPIDGRYASKTAALANYFSEFGLIHYRVKVELAWFQALASEPSINEVPQLSQSAIERIQQIADGFSLSDAKEVKDIEATTNHDVKAVEYFIKRRFESHNELAPLTEFVHFACTSEDINNLSYAWLLKDAMEHDLLHLLCEIRDELKAMAFTYKKVPMMARTHGQPASPTTLGKEFANVYKRIARQLLLLERQEYLGKINGAVGNYNAHLSAYPDTDWHSFSQQFVESLGLTWNPYTTQIEPHDFIAELFHNLTRISTILIDLSRDVWGYIALGHFKQKTKAGEIGSSTMPHKVNPIDFENAEGNLGMAIAIFEHLATKLPLSRWQRDLTDSTVLRNLGVGLGYLRIALASLGKGLHKLEVNEPSLQAELANNWELLAEPIQTVMRKHGIDEPYEKLKELTRGKRVDANDVAAFIDGLTLPESVKHELTAMTPANYIGAAIKLVDSLE